MKKLEGLLEREHFWKRKKVSQRISKMASLPWSATVEIEHACEVVRPRIRRFCEKGRMSAIR